MTLISGNTCLNFYDISDLVEASEDDSDTTGSTTRKSLEQKRAILQSIKDFNFQIKKNQEDIGVITQRMESFSIMLWATISGSPAEFLNYPGNICSMRGMQGKTMRCP